MSDLASLNLYDIHHDAAQLAKLHNLQRDRLAENQITGGDRPTGMRLSIADPVRRVKAALDPFWAIPFDDGIGSRGHILEDYLEVALFHTPGARFHGCDYETQVAIQWHQHGRSAYDYVVRDGSDRVVSCKSSVNDTKPSAENIAQERRMMAADGYPAGSVFEVWMLNPSTFRAVGPFEYTLEQDHIDAWRAELAGVDKAYRYFDREPDPVGSDDWNSPSYWLDEFGLESTSGAFRFTTLDASGAIEARNRAYLRARNAAREAKRVEDEAKALIRAHVEEQIAAAVAAGEQAKSVTAFSGDEIATYTLDKRGAMRCTTKPLETADAAA